MKTFLLSLNHWEERQRKAIGVLRLQNLRRTGGIERGREIRGNKAMNETQSE